jgi:amino acid efflux transporter
MLSFVGWEAVAPLTGRLRAGQLSRVIGIAFTVTAVLYLGLAVATVSCLGQGADLNVPLADLLQLAIGPAGRAVAAVAALVLTAGSVNAYISGATEMLRELTAVPGQKGPNGPGRPPRISAHALLGIIAMGGLLLIGLSALRLADIVALVSVPTAMFLCVYLSCTAAATRILAGPARVAAAVAVLAVLAVLVFCGWQALLAVAVVAAVASYPPGGNGRMRTVAPRSGRSADLIILVGMTAGRDREPSAAYLSKGRAWRVHPGGPQPAPDGLLRVVSRTSRIRAPDGHAPGDRPRHGGRPPRCRWIWSSAGGRTRPRCTLVGARAS